MEDELMTLAILVVFAHTTAAMLLGWLYFRRYAIQRPPIGVFNLRDVAFMLTGIVVVPYLYLWLPLWFAAGLLGLGALSILYFVLEPVIPVRPLIWLIVGGVLAAEVGAAWGFGGRSATFFSLNNLVQLLVVVGVTNSWAQSGMKTRDAAILGAALIIYDFTFTSLLTMMRDLITHLAGLPFAPMVVWPYYPGQPFPADTMHWLGIGLGDLLLATVFPLVMRKAYGRRAGLTALGLGSGAIGAVMLRSWLGVDISVFPVMVVLGPLMGLQYLYWRRRCGPERTTWQYLQAEPLSITSLA
jgi:hypothetical protein